MGFDLMDALRGQVVKKATEELLGLVRKQKQKNRDPSGDQHCSLITSLFCIQLD